MPSATRPIAVLDTSVLVPAWSRKTLQILAWMEVARQVNLSVKQARNLHKPYPDLSDTEGE